MEYNTVYVITNVIFVYAIYNLFKTFFGDAIYPKKENLSFIVYFALSTPLIFITRIPYIILGFTLLSLMLLSLNYDCAFQKRIIYISFIYSILSIIELSIAISIGYIDIILTIDSSFDSTIGLILIRTITMIISYLMKKHTKLIKSNTKINPLYYFSYFIILFGTIYLFIQTLENRDIELFDILISGGILILINVMMIITDEKIYKAAILEYEKNVLEQQNIAYENQTEIIQQSNNAMKLIRHDMKNHIYILEELYQNGKKEEAVSYINTMLHTIDKNEFANSNNFVIDSIMNFKLRILKDTDTKITLNICVPQTINILAYDITVILGNLMDNSITALLQCAERKLDIKISTKMDNLIILIDNSFDGKIIEKDGKLQTTKIGRKMSGLGISSIEKILENYGGEIRTSYTHNEFSVAVLIPY